MITKFKINAKMLYIISGVTKACSVEVYLTQVASVIKDLVF